MARTRQFLGAIGLLTVAIFGSLFLLSLATNPESAPVLLVWTSVGLALWGQAIASQVGLTYRRAVEWLLVLISITIAVGVIVLLTMAGAGAVFGPAARGAGYVAVAVVAASARRNPRRAAILNALGRAALARAKSDDAHLLAAGPIALLRPGSMLNASQ